MAIALRAPVPASCHPTRPTLAAGLCSACYHRRWRRAQRDTHPTVVEPAGPFLPSAPAGPSHTFTDWPTVCPKCGNAMLEQFGREAHCPSGAAGCGWTGYLIRAR
jgi:hypothetical protein